MFHKVVSKKTATTQKKTPKIKKKQQQKKLRTVHCVAQNVGRAGGFKASLSHGGSTLGSQLSSVRGTFNGVSNGCKILEQNGPNSPSSRTAWWIQIAIVV